MPKPPTTKPAPAKSSKLVKSAPASPAPTPSTRTSTKTPPPPSFSTFTRLSRSRTFTLVAERAIELRTLVAVGEHAKLELTRLGMEQLEPELLTGGVNENVVIDYHGARIRIADEGSGTRLDPALLIRAGVSKKVIAAATVENKRKHYISIELPLDQVNQALREAELPEKETKRTKREGGEIE